MNHHAENQSRVTLLLHDSRDQPWPLDLSANCAQFIGRYPRLSGFGVRGMLLDFLPQHGARLSR